MEPKNTQCDQCGKAFRKRLTEDAYLNGNCFDCSFWLKKVGKTGQVIVNGVHYRINDNTTPFRGFGGRKFDIAFHDGRKIKTNSLWCQGKIPTKFRELIPDNAVFISPKSTKPIVNAYDIPI